MAPDVYNTTLNEQPSFGTDTPV